MPETAVEAYLLRLIKQMRDEASKALAARQWVGLTYDEIAEICAYCAASAYRWDDFEFARAVEAKLKEKNT